MVYLRASAVLAARKASTASEVQSRVMAFLDRLQHGVERLEELCAAGDEAIIVVEHPQKLLQLALCGKLRELLDGFTAR